MAVHVITDSGELVDLDDDTFEDPTDVVEYALEHSDRHIVNGVWLLCDDGALIRYSDVREIKPGRAE